MGCGSTSPPPPSVAPTVGKDIAQKYNFNVVSEAIISNITLPQQMTGPDWGLKEGLCEQAGYSLVPFAGQNVSIAHYSITNKWNSESLYLWVVAKDQASICGYLSVREGSGLIPGVFAVNDSNIK